MNQTTSADNFINTTVFEGATDDVCPIGKTGTELLISTQFVENLSLNGNRRILLLKGQGKTFKECFIQDIGADETTVVRTFTLGVGSSNHSETRSRFHPTTNLLKEDTLTF